MTGKVTKKYMLQYPVQPIVKVPIVLSKPMRVAYGQSFGQDFSWNGHDSFYGQWGMKGHNGEDFPAPVGTPIYAPCDLWIDNYMANETYGDVLWAYSDSWVVDGVKYRLEMNFGHLKEELISHKKVKRGDHIGISGNSGFPVTSTGPHLHWGVRLQKMNVRSKWQVVDHDNGYKGYFNQYLITQNMFQCKRVNEKEIYFIDEINNTAHHISALPTYKMGLKAGLWGKFEDVPTIANYKKGLDIMANQLS